MTRWSPLLFGMVMAATQARPGWASEVDHGPCLSNPETREAMQARAALPPFRAVATALREGGDLVAIRLCRGADPALVYDVAVLRRDGHLVHVMVDAATGAALPGRRRP